MELDGVFPIAGVRHHRAPWVAVPEHRGIDEVEDVRTLREQHRGDGAVSRVEDLRHLWFRYLLDLMSEDMRHLGEVQAVVPPAVQQDVSAPAVRTGIGEEQRLELV